VTSIIAITSRDVLELESLEAETLLSARKKRDIVRVTTDLALASTHRGGGFVFLTF
jgi:hypothetical protein